MAKQAYPKRQGSYFRSGRSYEQNGRSRAGYSYQGAEPFQKAPSKQEPKEKGDGGFPEPTDEQQLNEDDFLNGTVFPLFLQQTLDHPRYAWRYKQPRKRAAIEQDLKQTLIDDVRRWMQKHFQKELCNPIGTYTRTQLVQAGNALRNKKYFELLEEAYGDVNNGWQRTKQSTSAS
jgi:hypothetical protein